MFHPMWLGAFYGLSEMAISLFLRSKGGATSTDQGSLRLIWRVIGLGMLSAFLAYRAVPGAQIDIPGWDVIGFVVFAVGIALRWYSIAYLGKFFTVDVAIASDHKVVDTGPYRFIRHPSYTGALLAFLGLGIALENWLSLLVLIVPITGVFLFRIRLEEAALQTGLGEAYSSYMQRTKRLIPFVY